MLKVREGFFSVRDSAGMVIAARKPFFNEAIQDDEQIAGAHGQVDRHIFRIVGGMVVDDEDFVIDLLGEQAIGQCFDGRAQFRFIMSRYYD